MTVKRGVHLFVGQFSCLMSLIACCLAPVVAAAEGEAAPPAVKAQDTAFLVVGVTDLSGALTVSVVSDSGYSDIKKEVALDNMAMATAYNNIKAAVYDKNAADYKAERKKLLDSLKDNKKGGTPPQMKRASNVFPVPVPKARELRFYGKYASEAAASAQKKIAEDGEAAKLAAVQKSADDKAKLENMAGGLKKPTAKKKEEVEPPKELVDQIAAEYDKVKKEMSEDPGYAATGKKTEKPEEGAGAVLKRGRDPKQKMADTSQTTMKNTKKIKGEIGK